MGRRAHPDSAETFDDIVRVAKQLIASEGAAKLSLRRVATLAGLTIGSVQYYFRSKDQLIEHCLSAHSQGMGARLNELRDSLDTPDQAEQLIITGVLALYQQGRQDRELYRLRVLRALGASSTVPSADAPFLVNELRKMAQVLVEVGGLDPMQAGLQVQTLAILVARYAIFEDEELAAILGCPPDRVASHVERHFTHVVQSLMRNRIT